MDKTELKRKVDGLMQAAGYLKKSAAWYKRGRDALVVVDLQKSDFGNYYYMNVGVALAELMATDFPKVKDCHISMRADGLLSAGGGSLDRGLNLDDGSDEDVAEAMRLIQNELLPLMGEFLTVEGLRRHHERGTFKRALVFWQAREMLDAPKGA